jgi:hypothetical protein
MAILKFKAADVKRVLLHALQSKDWTPKALDYGNEANGWTPTYDTPKPAVILVHDDGVYLMSNGNPRDIIEGEDKPGKGRSFVAYAEGCNPLVDEDCWEMARALVGGDDFADHLDDPEWLKQMGERALKGQDVRIRFSANSMRLL